MGPNSAIFSGITSETLSVIGAYDLCINAKAVSENSEKNKVMFYGKYCAFDIFPPSPPRKPFQRVVVVPEELKNFSTRDTVLGKLAKSGNAFFSIPYHVGLCVPSGCSKSDMDHLAKAASDYTTLSINVRRCEMKEENKFTPLIITVLTIYSFMVFFVIIGSFVDHYYSSEKRSDGFALGILRSFSATRNLTKLLDTSTSSDNLRCLHGIRFLTISWIILSHTYLNLGKNIYILHGILLAGEKLREFGFQAIIQGTLAVDTFFFLGGMLVCYVVLKSRKESNKPFNLKLYIFHRIWRILPMQMFVIGFVFLFDLYGSGPMWHNYIDPVVQPCYDIWWQNVLFVNNLLHTKYVTSTEYVCLAHTWYVSCDMQLYIFALVILLPLARWPKFGLVLAFGTILTSMGVTGALAVLNNYPPTFTTVHSNVHDHKAFHEVIYSKPYVHAGPYCIGILVSYLLVTRPKLKMPKIAQLMGWCISLIFSAYAVFGSRKWNIGEDATVLETFLFSSCSRVAWTLGVAWVVICCCTGHGGVINKMLSWKVWIPLGRLTFLAYLIHPLIQVSIAGLIKTEMTFNHPYVVFQFFGFLLATYGISFFVNIIIEAPLGALEKVFMHKGTDHTHNFPMKNGNSNVMNMKKCEEDISSPVLLTSATVKGSENNGFEYSCSQNFTSEDMRSRNSKFFG